MNCQELQDNIKNLKDLHAKAQAKLEKAVATSRGKSEVISEANTLSSTTDQILGQYLNDFNRQFPELFMTFKLGESIGEFSNIWDEKQLSDDEFIISEYDVLDHESTLYIFRKSNDGNWAFEQKPIVLKQFQHGNSLRISNEECLLIHNPTINETNSRIYVLTKNNDNWQIKQNPIQPDTTIHRIIEVSGNECLLISQKAIYTLKKDGNENWPKSPKKMLEGFNSIRNIHPLSDHKYLVLGSRIDNCIIRKTNNGNWEFAEDVAKPEIYDDVIYSVAISKDDFLIATYYASEIQIQLLTRNQKEWSITDISEVEDLPGKPQLKSVTRISDDEFLMLFENSPEPGKPGKNEYRIAQFKKDGQGKWQCDKFSDTIYNNAPSIIPIANKLIIIDQDSGKISSNKENSNRKWETVKKISVLSPNQEVYSTMPLSDDQILVTLFEDTGFLNSHILSIDQSISLDNLKQNINNIIDENEES